MKRTVAIVLIILGIVALIFQGVTYTTHKKVIDLGPIEASKEEKEHIPLPPVLGAIALVGGIVLLATSRRAT